MRNNGLIYTSTSDAHDDDAKKFYEQLKLVLKILSKREIVIIIGNNANIRDTT